MLTSSCSPCQPGAGEAPQGRVSVDEPRGATHRGPARLGPEQRLQDRGPSERELRPQELPRGGPRARGDHRGTAPHLATQNAPTTAGGG